MIRPVRRIFDKAVGLTFDLKVAEEAVGAEEVEGLFDDVWLTGVGYTSVLHRRHVCCQIPAAPDPVEERASLVRDNHLHEIGAGPLILVVMGNTAILPSWRTEGSVLNAEWYACAVSSCSSVVRAFRRLSMSSQAC